MHRLKSIYKISTVMRMKKKFKYNNNMLIPILNKVVINFSSKIIVQKNNDIKSIYDDLFLISKQRALITKAKKSISNFKLRKNINIGLKITLRARNMYIFLDKLISVVLPKLKDFYGISCKKISNTNNLSFSTSIHLFPGIKYSTLSVFFNINIVSSCKSTLETRYLLSCLNVPFIE